MINSSALCPNLGVKPSMVLTAVLAFAGFNAAAIANQTSDYTRVKHVSLTDLDLSTSQGQRAARERLHQVARTLCSQVADSFDLSHHANYVACVETAMTKAEPQLIELASRNVAVPLARNQAK